MIRFDKLRLHNYRCFKECEITFQPDLTVLVARNGQGKTAVLDAVALVLGLFVDTVSGTTIWSGFRKRDIRRIREGDTTVTPPGFIQFEAEAEIGGHQLSWRRWMRNEAKQERTSKSEAKPLIGVSEQIHDRLQLEDGVEPFVIPLIAYYGTGRQLRGIRTKLARQNIQLVNERCQGYIDCLNGMASYGLFVDWYESTFTSLGRHTPVTGTLKANRPEFLLAAVNRAVESVLKPETGWHGLRWDSDERQLILEHPAHGKLPLGFLSDGVRNTVALVADVAHRCARLNPHFDDAAKETPGILLVDEIDLHLHPEWQQRIIDMLRSTFPKLQLIVSTHSPQVLSTVYAKQIRVFCIADGMLEVKEPDFQTRGVESADVLLRIMRVDPAPRVSESTWLNEYRALIEDGRDESDAARALRVKLIAHFGEDHPLILDCDRLNRFTRFKRKRADGGNADHA